MGKCSICVLFRDPEGFDDTNFSEVRSVLSHMDPDKYELFPVGITGNGDWFLWEMSRGKHSKTVVLTRKNGASPVAFTMDRSRDLLIFQKQTVIRRRIDAVLPLLPEYMGAARNLPVVRAGDAGDLLADKALSRLVAEKEGIPTVCWKQVRVRDLDTCPERILDELEQSLSYPLYIKTARRHEEAGVYPAVNRLQLWEGLCSLRSFGGRLLVESVVDGWEVEVAVMGSDVPMATVCAEIDTAETANAFIPARIPPMHEESVRETAVKLFERLCCRGMAKFSFYIRYDDGAVIFDSADGAPGLGETSLVTNLFAASGISMAQMLDRLVELAMEEPK